MEIKAILVFKSQSNIIYHDYVCIFKLIYDEGWWWDMIYFLEAKSSPYYERRKIIAKEMARKHHLKVIYVKNRFIWGIDYYFVARGIFIKMRTKFHKRDLV